MSGGKPRRVLVVDDDEMIRSVLSEALTDEGYDTRTATNGLDALDLVDGWLPDVILLDLMMPQMDGWTFRQHQREHPALKDIPVVVLSARRDLSDQARMLEPAEIVAKPFDLDALLTLVERLANVAA